MSIPQAEIRFESILYQLELAARQGGKKGDALAVVVSDLRSAHREVVEALQKQAASLQKQAEDQARIMDSMVFMD